MSQKISYNNGLLSIWVNGSKRNGHVLAMVAIGSIEFIGPLRDLSLNEEFEKAQTTLTIRNAAGFASFYLDQSPDEVERILKSYGWGSDIKDGYKYVPNPSSPL